MEVVVGVIVIVIIIVLLFYFMKKIAFLFIAALIIFGLFNVIFVWNGSEVVEHLYLNKILSEEDSNQVEEWLNKFSLKREEHSVVDTEAISENAKNIAIEKTSELKEDIKNLDKEQIIAEFKKIFEGLNSEQIDNIIKENKHFLEEKGITESDILE